MARGPSGRLVIEVDPELKRELYSALYRNGHTLKSWFEQLALSEIQRARQPELFDTAQNQLTAPTRHAHLKKG